LENIKGRDHFRDLVVFGRLIRFKEIGSGGCNLMELAQDSAQLQAFVNVVINPLIPY
jgi:hypothetical protein